MQALQSVVVTLLNRYLSPYVDNLNSKDLNISLVSGNVQLHSLHLKPDLLERFGLPVDIVAGDIGHLHLSIPWGALRNAPSQLVVEDVYVLARNRPQGRVNEEEDERMEQSQKQEKLRNAETVDNAASQMDAQGQAEAKPGYIGAMIRKLTNNLQVEFRNIHVRYEDSTSNPDHPFAAGVTMAEFKMVSTDENWAEAFIEATAAAIHKAVNLSALGVYFDTDTSSLVKNQRSDTLNAVKAMLHGSAKHQHILKPVSGKARLILNNSMSPSTPRYDAEVLFDEIGVVFDHDQYRDTLSLLDVMQFYRRTHQYHKYRPPESEFKSNAAKARLKFALNAIQNEVHERHRRWTWDYLSWRRDMRIKYVDIYVKKLALPESRQLAADDAETLSVMEEELSYEDIRFFRSVARSQARKDAATRRKLEAEQQKNAPKKQTWGQWIWGTTPEAGADGMSEEEKKELDEIIEYNPEAEEHHIEGTPKDFMRARVSARLNKGSLSLRTDPHGKNSDVIAIVFDSLSANGLQLTESISAKLALGGFRVYDGTTPDSLYPQIVRVKDVESSTSTPHRQKSLDVQGTDEALAEIEDGLDGDQRDADPFFQAEFEHLPLDGRAENALTVKMRHLEIIYHKDYVESIVAFFRPPESQMESITALISAAGETLDSVRKETRAGLEYALEQHKTVDVRMDMNAPIIIIPMDIRDKSCQAIVLDAGHIAVETNLANQEQLRDLQAKRGRAFSDEDYRQLEGLLYDRYSVKLEAAQLLMGGTVDASLKALEDPHGGETDLHLLERINMSFHVQKAITELPTLTKFKIAGDLPELQINFSDRRYKTLMRFIDVSVPNFGGEKPISSVDIARNADKHPALQRPAAVEEYTLDDNHSIASRRSSAERDSRSSLDEGRDKFYEANDDTTDQQRAALQQVSFEFSFSVGKLQASLFKSVSATEERALANASLSGFGLEFRSRQYDMAVDLYLRTVLLGMAGTDYKDRPLLSSAKDEQNDADHKLVQVRYMRVQKDSPEFMTVHEGVDQSVDVDLSTFKITFAPEPILSLYDFIMTTFTSRDEQAAQHGGPAGGDKTVASAQSEHGDQPEDMQSSDKMRIRVKLTSAQASLENNDDRFALLQLPSADVAIMLRAGAMRVSARLGNISLEDLTESDVAVPEFKKLLTIQGEELADFSYETFDPADKETFPGYNSSVHLRAGSLKFTFVERSIQNLYTWALKFARMKAIYDAASQAAVQRASEVTKLHYDIEVKTPIIVLPQNDSTSPDVLVLRLGEIVAKNEYLDDGTESSTIDASLQGINVASELTVNDQKIVMQIVDNVGITAKIRQSSNEKARADPHHADMDIKSEMSDVRFALTQRQYVLVMSVLESLPRALSALDEEVSFDPESLPMTPVRTYPSTPIGSQSTLATPTAEQPTMNLEPELVPIKSDGGDSVWTSLILTFVVNSISFEIFTVEAIRDDDLKRSSIARFALVQTHVGLKQFSNGGMEADFSLKTLEFSNTRRGNSVFRDIIPPAEHDGNQIMVQYTKSGGSDPAALAIVTVDSPRFTLAVDPLAALLEFAVSPFKNSAEPDASTTQDRDDGEPAQQTPQGGQGGLAFRVEIVQSTVIVVADDTNPKTQAIQLSIKEVLLSRQGIVALKVSELGMSFGRMDRPADRVRFLDEVNVALSLDTRQKGQQSMTSFEIEIPDPVIFRASYTDIMLISDIVSKATQAATKAMSGSEEGQESPGQPKDRRRSSLGIEGPAVRAATSIVPTAASSTALTPLKPAARRKSVSNRRRTSLDRSQVIVSKEELRARINGFQFVLVGDLQEMPFVHLSTPEFQVIINDWSGDLKMATSITPQIRYFNLTNSHFEPLMDPWKFDLRVDRSSVNPGTSPLNVRLTAAERLEVNLSSAFIELAITTATVWSKEGEKVKEGRRDVSPFEIRNRTGKSLLVWSESRDLNKQIKGVKQLDDGADVPWRFENRKQQRDNVSAVRHNALGVQIQDTPWEPLRAISVDREGEHIQILRPRLEKVSHQLVCEIKIENNVKIITLRSTLNVANETSLPVEMIVVDQHGKAAGGAMRIDPGEALPLPLEAAYDKRFRLRPLRGFGFDYSWSSALHWRQLVSRPIRPISCKHITPREPAFYFQAQANYDEKDPGARAYPRMRLVLRAPVELENLLPYDIKFRIHDKATGLSSSNFLVKGGSSPIHTVELGHLLLLSVAPEDTNLKQSEYAIINTDDPELPIEDKFDLTDQQGIKLTLKLHYYTYPNSGSAFTVQIYSPFIFMNKTGLPFDLNANTWTGGKQALSGSDLFANDHNRDTPTPFMFSFPSDDRRSNKLFLAMDGSKWSKPMSFDPVSADMQVVMQSQKTDSNYYIGLSYAEGLGKYKLTKVITIAPRFLVKNMFSYPLRFRQHSTEDVWTIKPGEQTGITQLRVKAPPQLSVAFDEGNLRWSSPFNIGDIGRTNITLQRQTSRGLRTYLLRIETHILGSSIFLYVSRESEPWPLKLQNDTATSFAFQQIGDDSLSDDQCPRRDLPAHGTIEYTWDYPTAANKRIRLFVDGVALDRPIDMMEIGAQPPAKIVPKRAGARGQTVSLDVKADGSSQLLIISPYNEDTSVYKPARRQNTAGGMRRADSMDSLATQGFETVQVSERATLNVLVDLAGIGVSVITRKPDELLYLSLRGLKLGYSDYPTYHDAFIDCKWIQIDNQLFGGLYPIILYPTQVPTSGKELESHPTLQASVALLKDRSHGVTYVKYATILLQTMAVEIDEDFLFALLDFTKFKGAAWKEAPQDILIEHPKAIPEPDATIGRADLFFEALQLQPISLLLSLMRTDRVNVDEKVSTRNPFYYALNALTMALGNVNEAPLNFRSLGLENVRLSIPSLQERVVLHYQEQVTAQLFSVLGSADFLGNPVGLFNNISSGFSDIFYEPYQGIVMHGNKDIGLGIARGATSFAKKTIFGVTDSMTKFTSSIGKGLSAATLDQEYQSKRRMNQRRNKPKHALYGIAAGAGAFADSVTSAFEGVASKPMEGAEKGGAAGFAKGVGKGFVGLFTKPAVGVMDFLSASTEGIRNTTTVFDQGDLEKVRFPRFIATDGVLRAFSEREAIGQKWLKEIDAGEYFHESYVAHLDTPGDDAVAILSQQRILFVSLRKMRSIWQVSFEELQSLSLEPTGIALVLRGGTPGPFLPVTDEQGRQWFFKQVGRCVMVYNQSHTSGYE